MHHPAFSSSKHGSEEPVRKRWVPLFAGAGIKLVLSGHDHDYERTTPQSGVTYITTGGGPGNSTVVPGILIYRLAFGGGAVGVASALAVVLTLVIFAVVLVINRLSREQS
jgi:ABC-type sulfate transport system permease component